jgi:hypothetical protein
MKQISVLPLILFYLMWIPALQASSVGIILPGNPVIVPGTIAADQAIEYNTPPHLLTGTAPTGGTQPYIYQWQSSIDNNSFSNISGGTDLFYQPEALIQTTWYRLIQYSSGRIDSAYTNTVRIFVYGMSVGEPRTSEVSVFPNPTMGNVTLELSAPAHESSMLEVFTSIGYKVMSVKIDGLQKYSIPLESSPPGVYFFKLTDTSGSQVMRVIRK